MIILRRALSSYYSIHQFTHFSLKRNMSTPTKLAKLVRFIGTHDGTFHCDDVTACFMLKQLDRFKNHEIIRTRNQDELSKAEIVVDVGGELDIETLRLDHHQRTFNQTIKDYYPNFKTTNPNKPVRLSSSGLVFAVFGKDIIMKLANLEGDYQDISTDQKQMVDAIFQKAYLEIFEEIDAIDNGVEIATGDNIAYNYHINSNISSRVGRLNPLPAHASDEERMIQFNKAMELVGSELTEGIRFLAQVWYPKRQQFREDILKRKEFDPSGQIVYIQSDDLIGWKSALVDFEEDLGIVGELKFIIHCGDKSNTKESSWRAHAVPVEPKSFASRVPLKEEWRGKRDSELQEVSKVPDAVFVHMSGFTGGAQSLEGIKSMVRKTLNLE